MDNKKCKLYDLNTVYLYSRGKMKREQMGFNKELKTQQSQLKVLIKMPPKNDLKAAETKKAG